MDERAVGRRLGGEFVEVAAMMVCSCGMKLYVSGWTGSTYPYLTERLK